jgi:hypothetical protein
MRFLKVTPDQLGQASRNVGPEWVGQWAGVFVGPCSGVCLGSDRSG